MKRRELFALFAGAGLPDARVEAIPATPGRPALIVIECTHPISDKVARGLKEAFEHHVCKSGSAFAGVPVVVMCEGLRAVFYGADGRRLNQPLENRDDE
jgi:hypothetical protein